jgi:hypothetical protein
MLTYEEFVDVYGDELYIEFMETGAYYDRVNQETFCQAQYDMYLDQFSQYTLKEVIMDDLVE